MNGIWGCYGNAGKWGIWEDWDGGVVVVVGMWLIDVGIIFEGRRYRIN